MSWVQYQSRACARVAGSISDRGHVGGSRSMNLSSLMIPSLSPFLSEINKNIFLKKTPSCKFPGHPFTCRGSFYSPLLGPSLPWSLPQAVSTGSSESPIPEAQDSWSRGCGDSHIPGALPRIVQRRQQAQGSAWSHLVESQQSCFQSCPKARKG
uniref:Uncharacterized protein n=1 Tax=Pipistrellus kuhlii TaxID=59472 RepID=A0A7J7SFN8_PIPKU|nr:hypothetical protein mPipKuh1_009991 [Pipistrellus kuhlii]